MACMNGRLETAKFLAAEPIAASMSKPDVLGRTPAFHAASNARLAVVKWLAFSGADVTSPDRFGKTPLSLATEMKATPLVRFLETFFSVREAETSRAANGVSGADEAIALVVRRLATFVASKPWLNNSWFKLFRLIDADNSGAVTEDEFAHAIRHDLRAAANEVSQAELTMLWTRMDADSSGTVTAGELAGFMRRYSPRVASESLTTKLIGLSATKTEAGVSGGGSGVKVVTGKAYKVLRHWGVTPRGSDRRAAKAKAGGRTKKRPARQQRAVARQ